MTPEQHQAEHIRLHQMLDQLVACYIVSHRFGLLNRASIHDELVILMQWSYEMTMKPTPSPENTEEREERTSLDFEGERQMILLALAELALSRPGWDDALRRIAKNYDDGGLPMFEELKRLNADRVKETHKANL